MHSVTLFSAVSYYGPFAPKPHQIHSSTAGKLLLIEMVVPSDNRPDLAQAMDLNMLAILGGRERTEEEYRTLLQASGFRLERMIFTHSPFSVIEATPV